MCASTSDSLSRGTRRSHRGCCRRRPEDPRAGPVARRRPAYGLQILPLLVGRHDDGDALDGSGLCQLPPPEWNRWSWPTRIAAPPQTFAGRQLSLIPWRLVFPASPPHAPRSWGRQRAGRAPPGRSPMHAQGRLPPSRQENLVQRKGTRAAPSDRGTVSPDQLGHRCLLGAQAPSQAQPPVQPVPVEQPDLTAPGMKRLDDIRSCPGAVQITAGQPPPASQPGAGLCAETYRSSERCQPQIVTVRIRLMGHRRQKTSSQLHNGVGLVLRDVPRSRWRWPRPAAPGARPRPRPPRGVGPADHAGLERQLPAAPPNRGDRGRGLDDVARLHRRAELHVGEEANSPSSPSIRMHASAATSPNRASAYAPSTRFPP